MTPEQKAAALEAIEKGDATAALELLKEVLAGAPAGGEEGALSGTPAAPTEEQQASLAAMSAISTALGASNPGEAVTRLTSLIGRVEAIESNARTVELSERRGLIADLVELGAETPATAWTGDAKDRNPVKRLADEPIAELRTRVTALKAQRPAPAARPPRGNSAPASGDAPVRKLSAREEQAVSDYCRKHNLTREQFEARKAEAVRSN